ncbi:MAG: DNA cytosine methyltransferase [Bacteroidales bacterium]
MTVISGRRCCALLTKSGPLGSLVRTLLESPRWSSPARLLTWDVKVLCSVRVTEFTDTAVGGGFTVERVCSDLEGSGYSVQPVLIPACAVGAPHRRDRIFFVAHATGNGNCGASHGTGKEVRRQDRHEVEQPVLGGCVRASSDSNSMRLQRRWGECDIKTEDETVGDNLFCKPQRFGGERHAPDSYGKRLSAVSVRDGNVEKKRKDEKRCAVQYPRDDWRASLADRWHDFPTVSPVCRRDDGLPFDVDDLAIPYTRWRMESIKAYGNAIVPQVIYEIFRAIEAAD